jgi:DNA repair exonuclease SbcCD ATPase subunit
MRIIGLKSENIKRLRTIDLTPNNYINRISGANGSGKTSILDSIEWALTGTTNVPTQPVRKGAGKAHIQIDLGDMVVTRRFFENGSRNGTLALESKSNKSRYASPQALLDGLMGRISFDPLEFLRMKPEKQAEVLRSLVKLDIDIDALDTAYQKDYHRRRDAKKERDSEEVRRNAIGVPDNLPKQKIDEAALVEELRQVSNYNEDIARQDRERRERVDHRNNLARDITENKERIEELQAKISELQEETAQWVSAITTVDAELAALQPLPPLKNAEELAAKITEARTINHGLDRRRLRDSYTDAINRLDAEIEELSAAMKEREETRAKAISEAEFPVPGLAFGDNEVIYEGIPFGQVSNADQIRASVAIGMASNPELRVMRIKDGSLLDSKSMNIISEMAHEQDFQVFVEVVDTTGKVGVYLEDGEVKAVNAEPEPKPTAKKKGKKIPATA